MTFSTRASGNISPAAERMRIDQNGNVGIGTTSPGAAYKLDVNGTIHAATGVVFPDGITQTVAFQSCQLRSRLCRVGGCEWGQDEVRTGRHPGYRSRRAGQIPQIESGVFDAGCGDLFDQAGFVGRLHPQDAETNKTEVPMAMVGRVPTKVSAENGPIKVGDLLVASSTHGLRHERHRPQPAHRSRDRQSSRLARFPDPVSSWCW